jgi:8-oxo-dGTP pyrophosphatase MutT (NUDIX family)
MTSASVVSANLIRVAAALVLDPAGQTLLVRKRGTTAFMQPGGKIEAHELPVHALARELEEELGLQIDPAQAAFLGQFSAPAANEPGFVVQAQIFQLTIDTEVMPAAEIEEVIWVDPATDPVVELAPLTRDLILPFYRQSLTAIA